MLRLGLSVFILYVLSFIAQGVDLPQTIIQKLQPGDIIIRKGAGALSYQLMEVSGENYSHCGVVVFDKGQPAIIQSIAKSDHNERDGVQLSSVHDFVKYTADSMLYICRPIVDSSKNALIAQRAFFYLGQSIPFDNRFDLTDETKFYCSELIIHIFLDVFGEPILEIRPQHKTYVPLFASFFDLKKFSPIYSLHQNK